MPEINCVCGNTQFREFKKVPWIVTSEGVTKESSDMEMTLGECKKCGVVHQMGLPFSTQAEHTDFYKMKYPPIKKVYVAKTYEHDRQLAVLRCDEYGIRQGCTDRILDIGSGSGAFVDECRTRGADVCGCEIAVYACEADNSFIYRRRFEAIHFPTDHFDKITCHDILEHVLDPIEFLKGIFRTLKQGGVCFIDIPRFFHESGRHHWKAIEHIWYFKTEQLEKILKEIGFVLISVEHPIESKTVFQVVKPTQDRISILLPPGIGDSYWSLVKMQSFLEQEGCGLPDIYVACPKERKYQGHKRAFPFIEMFPFLHSSGVTLESLRSPQAQRIWKEAYARQGRTIFKDVFGYDYFISYNGHLRVGAVLEEIDPTIQCNWLPPMFVSLQQEYFKAACIQQYGDYIVFYFAFRGTYSHWTEQFPIESVIKFVQQIVKKTGCIPVFAGALWDKEDDLLNQVKMAIPNCVDLVGKTNVPQLFGLLRGSKAVVGYPSGLTIVATMLKKKTLIIWNDYYNSDFTWNACPPSVRMKTYFAENTRDISVDYLAEKVKEIVEWKEGDSAIKCRIPYENKVTQNALKFMHKNNLGKSHRLSDPIITVVCVLKSGGTYTTEYVLRLRNMLDRNVTVPYRFLCLTDANMGMHLMVRKSEFWVTILKDDLPGWWSKIELFRPELCSTEYILYFDLDTVILKNIDKLLSTKYEFSALIPWNRKNRLRGFCASGIMGWKNGDYSFIYTDFQKNGNTKSKAGDQAHISACLTKRNIKFTPFQETIPGIYSYKRNCTSNGVPQDAKIVCFHGKPRLHEVEEPWVKQHWR